VALAGLAALVLGGVSPARAATNVEITRVLAQTFSTAMAYTASPTDDEWVGVIAIVVTGPPVAGALGSQDPVFMWCDRGGCARKLLSDLSLEWVAGELALRGSSDLGPVELKWTPKSEPPRDLPAYLAHWSAWCQASGFGGGYVEITSDVWGTYDHGGVRYNFAGSIGDFWIDTSLPTFCVMAGSNETGHARTVWE